MTMSVSLFALILGLLAPDRPAPPPAPVAKSANDAPMPDPSQPAPAPVQTVAVPACSLALETASRRLHASVEGPVTGFDGHVRLQLSGTGFVHDDQRPLHLDGSASMTLRVPSVPLPNDLQGELTILNPAGETVCTDRL
ncbi:MAG: hypothetical protein H6898_11855 [Rhodobacter sp.]|nr:hypothetical protein [Paracoccaceae bacterium]MCC0077262.1 hypothetical protein [Rhodobacter sp.]